jgi:hypothetical protein
LLLAANAPPAVPTTQVIAALDNNKIAVTLSQLPLCLLELALLWLSKYCRV